MELTDQAKYQAEQIANLRAVYALRGRRRDVFALIRAYPREEWLFLFDEFERLCAESYSGKGMAVAGRELVS